MQPIATVSAGDGLRPPKTASSEFSRYLFFASAALLWSSMRPLLHLARTLAHNRWLAFEVDEIDATFEWRSVVVKGALYVLEQNGNQNAIFDKALHHLRTFMPEALAEGDPDGALRWFAVALPPLMHMKNHWSSIILLEDLARIAANRDEPERAARLQHRPSPRPRPMVTRYSFNHPNSWWGRP